MAYQITQATHKLLNLKKRLRAVCGGTSASKTISILFIIIDYCQSNRNKRVDVMSESYPHLEDGAIKDFKEIMIDRGYWRDDRWNSTGHFYTFETGTVLKFKSVDKLGKAHGPRRDGLFLNECNNIDFSIFEQLEVRTKEFVWLDWNPTNEFWYYTEIKDKRDHDFITLTYLDCIEVLDQKIIDSIEARKNRKGWWQVYGLGQLGEVEGKIYRDWDIIDEIPHTAKLLRYGLDFGYTNDPTAIIAVYEYRGGYILDEVVCRKGVRANVIAELIINQENDALVVADSVDPDQIEEIKKHGISIVPVSKTKSGSKNFVAWSIELVQEQRISMTSRSVNLIHAYRNYLWEVDRDGHILNVPCHDFSDPMDALRYAFVSLLKKPLVVGAVQSSPVLPYYNDRDISF